MGETLTVTYAGRLSRLIQIETVSQPGQTDRSEFECFHEAIKREFPAISAACEWEEFEGSLLLRWRGKDPDKMPVLLMNHHDVVDAADAWKYPPLATACNVSAPGYRFMRRNKTVDFARQFWYNKIDP